MVKNTIANKPLTCEICGTHLQWISSQHLRSKKCQTVQKGLNLSIKNSQEYESVFSGTVTLPKSIRMSMGWTRGLTSETDDRVKHKGEKIREAKSKTTNWNKGLTKDTDPRVASQSKNVGKTLKIKHDTSELVIWNKGLTRETDSRVNDMWKDRQPWNLGLTKENTPCIKAQSEKVKGRVISKKEREHVAEGVKAYWENLSLKEKNHQLQIRLGSARERPNRSETKLIRILKPLRFNYNSSPIESSSRVPDFIHTKEKLIIEFDGDGGHNPRVPWIPDNKDDLDKQRNLEYKALGYETLSLTTNDLNLGRTHIISTINGWLQEVL